MARLNSDDRAIRKRLAVDRDLFLVAEVGGAIVATVMGGYDGHRGWIYSVAVCSEHRRRGIGSTLIRRMETALVERGCLKINLQVLAFGIIDRRLRADHKGHDSLAAV